MKNPKKFSCSNEPVNVTKRSKRLGKAENAEGGEIKKPVFLPFFTIFGYFCVKGIFPKKIWFCHTYPCMGP